MFQNERQEEIIRCLKEKKAVRIGDLTKLFNVTRETVRRDLYDLEKLGVLRKVHGGAILNKTGEEPPYAQRSVSRIKEKEAIARKAADLVDNGDTLYIDLGTSALLFSKELRSKQNITVITNSLSVAIEIAANPAAKVILSGGELRPGDLSLSGPISAKSIEDLFVDKSFIGAGGISLNHGITDYHLGESEVRRMMINRSKENFVLADFSKFNVTAFTKVCDLRSIDTIITDSSVLKDEVQQYQDYGVEIIVADYVDDESE